MFFSEIRGFFYVIITIFILRRIKAINGSLIEFITVNGFIV